MKNRRFPYGYEMQNGVIVICSTEESNVKWIFDEYIGGRNLKDIAECLTKNNIEYLNGNCNWNKSRIKRIIEDVRYIGNDIYTAIIPKSIYEKANSIKTDRRTYTSSTVTAESKEITSKVICGECGGKLIHRTDNTQKHSEKWYCNSESCKYGIPLSIDELKIQITEILNTAIANPMCIEPSQSEKPYEPTTETIKAENEIERNLETLDFDKTQVQNMILQCAAAKYAECKATKHITDRLTAEFEKALPQNEFNYDLFDRTVESVIINQNKTVLLKLKNGKIIGKESRIYDATAENGQSDTAQAGIQR